MKESLLNKIDNREITVGVVGLGYVGLPLAVEKAKAGFKTIGFDVQKAKVDLVNAGSNYIGDIVDDDLKHIVESGMLRATNDFSFVKDVDFIAICVPTPLDEHQQLPQALLSIVGGGPAAEIDGVRHPALQAGRKGPELGDEGLLIEVHFLFPPGQGVEVTVVTFTFAEGDVDIDAVCGGHRVPSYPA